MKRHRRLAALIVLGEDFLHRLMEGSAQMGIRTIAVFLAVQIAALPAIPAWAQRRDAEPEANPQFSQQDQSAQQQANSMEGSPLGASQTGGNSDSEYSSAPPPSIQVGQQLATNEEVPVKTNSALDKIVSVHMKDAPLATFLQTISAQSNINFIVTEGLETRSVTVFLQNVTVREALQVLLDLKGLTYQQVGRSDTYIVMPRSKELPNLTTRIYTLSFIPLIPVESSQAEQASITPSGTTVGSGFSGGGSQSTQSAAPPSAGNQSFVNAATRGCGGGGSGGSVPIVSIVCSVLSQSGRVMVDARTNSLIITDVPEVFPQVEQIISALDKKTSQVMIEAQIVEIDSDHENDLGISWGGNTGELASFTGGERDTAFPMALPNNLSRVRFLDPVTNIISALGTSSAHSGASTGGSSLNTPLTGSNVMTSVLNLTSLQVVLQALVSNSEARFLGKPKILTLNNKTATIQTADQQATFVPSSNNQSSATGGTVIQQEVTPERFTTGLILHVTPQINKDGYITMFIQPVFTNVQSSALSTATQAIFDPITRSASTLVRVKNGQTLVLGGLLQSTENKTVRKVPLLGYIPLVGWLFTSTTSSRINSDLVIFITPTIVTD